MKTELLPVIIPAVASNTVELGAQVFPSTDIVKAASPPPFLPPIIQDLPRKISFSISPPPTDSEPVKSLDHTLIIESLVGKVPPVEQPRTRKQTLLSRIGISNPGYKSEKSAGLESPKESFESPGKLKEKEKEKIKYLKVSAIVFLYTRFLSY